jgi:hypothetical protein
MADETDVKTPVSPATTLPLSEAASAHAPFLYFEDVPTFGYLNGIIRITLEAGRLYSSTPGQVVFDRVIVAHLRMNVPAALALKSAIEGALLLANPAPSVMKN